MRLFLDVSIIGTLLWCASVTAADTQDCGDKTCRAQTTGGTALLQRSSAARKSVIIEENEEPEENPKNVRSAQIKSTETGGKMASTLPENHAAASGIGQTEGIKALPSTGIFVASVFPNVIAEPATEVALSFSTVAALLLFALFFVMGIVAQGRRTAWKEAEQEKQVIEDAKEVLKSAEKKAAACLDVEAPPNSERLNWEPEAEYCLADTDSESEFAAHDVAAPDEIHTITKGNIEQADAVAALA